MERINIVMAVYNGEKYIKEQIESIINNTFTNWRLFIFDDGSSDMSCEIITQFLERAQNKIYYIKNMKNKGLTLNFLEGVKSISEYGQLSGSDYFMFCDQDDVWLNDKLETTLTHMKQIEEENLPIAVFTDAFVVDEHLNIQESSFFDSNHLNGKAVDINHILIENKLIGCTSMFNYDLYKKLKVLPERARFHDWWVALIASSFGKLSFLKKQTLLYRQHGNNIVGNKSFYSYATKALIQLRKQKDSIHECIIQGREFYKIYEQDLTQDKKKIIEQFISISSSSYLKKRKLMIKNRYFKSGIIRNIGLLFLV